MSTATTTTEIFGELREGEVLLPAEIAQDIKADPATDAQKIAAYKDQIDMSDSNSIVLFASKAQEQVTASADVMLEDVRTKDLGGVGDSLSSMVLKLKELDVSGLDPNAKKGFFARLLGLKTPIEKYMRRYTDVRGQIDEISNRLIGHQDQLHEDIAKLDRLYETNLDYFHELELYIDAGEAKLAELDATTIPAMAEKAAASEDVLIATELQDLRAARDDLERRVHDLKLTRQVTMQSLPSIRLVQQNDKSLVTKIKSTLVNTVPLWKNQMAQAVAIHNAAEAGAAIGAAQDFTNDLLKQNSENLRDSNAKIRRQIERGVFDIETVKAANDNLIATINESLQIADEAKQQRRAAEGVLTEAEAQLRETLAAAAAGKVPPKPEAETAAPAA